MATWRAHRLWLKVLTRRVAEHNTGHNDLWEASGPVTSNSFQNCLTKPRRMDGFCTNERDAVNRDEYYSVDKRRGFDFLRGRSLEPVRVALGPGGYFLQGE